MNTEEYNNTHRAFLQSFLAHATLTFPTAQPILASILGIKEKREVLAEDITRSDFNRYITSLSYAISPFDLEIRSAVHQSPSHTSTSDSSTSNPPTGNAGANERIYAIINTTSDPFTQMATILSAEEISYVKRLLDGIFIDNNAAGGATSTDTGSRAGTREVMALSSMQALSLAKRPAAESTQVNGATHTNGEAGSTQQQTQSTSAGLTMVQAEKVLQTLCEGGWFERSTGRGRPVTGVHQTNKVWYRLAPRGLMELRGWLVETYNNDDDEDDENEDEAEEGGGGGRGRRGDRIKLCYACKEIVTIGQRCTTRTCLCRLHDSCAQRLFNAQQQDESSRRCPICKSTWTGDEYVGERAAAAATTARSSTGSARRTLSAKKRTQMQQMGGWVLPGMVGREGEGAAEAEEDENEDEREVDDSGLQGDENAGDDDAGEDIDEDI